MQSYYVYMMSNKPNGTLYVGSTSDLIKRVWEHKQKFDPKCFTAKYNLNKLVYFEIHEMYLEAARREVRFKKWPRLWKTNLIELANESWDDLYHEICA